MFLRFAKHRLKCLTIALLLVAAMTAKHSAHVHGAEPLRDVAQAIELLAGKDSTQAAAAAAWLQEHKYNEQEIETLVEHQGDGRPAYPGPDFKYQYGAKSISNFTRILLRDIGRPAVPALIKLLKSEAPSAAKIECVKTCEFLTFNAQEAFPAIAELAKGSADKSLRYHAYTTLSQVTNDPKPLIAAFEPALRDKDPVIQLIAIQQLCYLKDDAKQLVPEIVKFLDSEVQVPNWYYPDLISPTPLALEVVEALGSMGTAANEALPKLSSKLQDKDAKTRLAAAFAHAAISGDKAPGVNILLKVATSAEKDQQEQAQWATMYLIDLAAKRKFVDVTDRVLRLLLQHPDKGVRRCAIHGIVVIKPADAVQLLRPLAESNHPDDHYVKEDAETAIHRLTAIPPDKKPE